MKRLARAALTVVAATTGMALVVGCGPTMRDLPLPGTGVSGDAITVTVQFDEALNLSQGAKVKVNGVDSGKVQSVSTKNFKAIAVLKVLRSAKVRSDAKARLRYTTPLGELFVDVTNPAEGQVLRDGSTLSKKNATTAPTVEDALSSASLLVNGGGLNQLQTVTDQLNKAIGGREDNVRQLLDRANTFLGEANATTGDIDAALRALLGLSRVLDANKSTINQAMTEIRPAAKVLRLNTPGLTELLAKVTEFSGTAGNVVMKTRTQILQLLREVSPVLQEFLDNRADLGLDDLVQVSKVLNQAVPGDYANMRLVIELDKLDIPNILGPGTGDGGSGGLLGGLLGGGSSGTGSGGSTSSGGGLLGGLGGLLGGLLGGGKTSGRTTAAPAATGSSGTLGDLLGGGR